MRKQLPAGLSERGSRQRPPERVELNAITKQTYWGARALEAYSAVGGEPYMVCAFLYETLFAYFLLLHFILFVKTVTSVPSVSSVVCCLLFMKS